MPYFYPPKIMISLMWIDTRQLKKIKEKKRKKVGNHARKFSALAAVGCQLHRVKLLLPLVMLLRPAAIIAIGCCVEPALEDHNGAHSWNNNSCEPATNEWVSCFKSFLLKWLHGFVGCFGICAAAGDGRSLACMALMVGWRRKLAYFRLKRP